MSFYDDQEVDPWFCSPPDGRLCLRILPKGPVDALLKCVDQCLWHKSKHASEYTVAAQY